MLAWMETASFAVWDWWTRWVGSERTIGWLRRWFPTSYGRTVFSVPDGQSIHLTIDDAPGDPTMFNALLDALQTNRCHATFFVIGSYVDKEPGRRKALERAVREGHTLANHLMEDRSAARMSEAEFEKALLDCQNIIDGICPDAHVTEKTRWFRPPCGALAAWMMNILDKHDYVPVLGTVYPNDCAHQSLPAEMVEYVVRETRDGDILILHSPEVGKRESQVGVVSAVAERFEGSLKALPPPSTLFNANAK